MMILNLSKTLAKPLVMAKLNMAYLSSLKNRAKLLSSYLPLSSLKNRAKLLSSYLPVSPSRVLRAPGTSPYHLMPKHLRTTWSRPEQSHLLPEACSPNGTDKRRQRQRQTWASSARTQQHSKEISLFILPRKTLFYEKRCLNYNACLTHFCLASPKWGRQILPKIAKKLRH